MDRIEGLRFLAEMTPVVSPVGRSTLLDSIPFTDSAALDREFDDLQSVAEVFADEAGHRCLEEILHLLMQTRDIRTTLRRLEEGETLSDIEFFELKGLVLTSEELREKISAGSLKEVASVALPPLGAVAGRLDPENTGSRHFHIYNAYSERLARCRGELDAAQKADDAEREADLMGECIALEQEVRETLSRELRPEAPHIQRALSRIGRLDMLIAKARMAREERLVRPRLAEDRVDYTGLRYLPVEKALRDRDAEFQGVDIRLERGVTLVTGANMGGKTVTLKSLAMAQAMAQYGFFIPALKGSVCPVEQILLSSEDTQSVNSGLSSFGAEILRIDGILRETAQGGACLVLIDEPARTTNPEEGAAIVGAVVEMLEKTPSFSVVTTHYSGISGAGCRLRVKGLAADAPERVGSIGQLSGYMDYGLEEAGEDGAPREALRIAGMLGISGRFADSIRNKLKQ